MSTFNRKRQIDKAIAELESQEPVADDFFKMIADRNPKPFPLPQRTWVGLTDEDRYEFAAAQYSWEELLIAAEAKLKQKNGYAEENT
jgi:hypothetical protein